MVRGVPRRRKLIPAVGLALAGLLASCTLGSSAEIAGPVVGVTEEAGAGPAAGSAADGTQRIAESSTRPTPLPGESGGASGGVIGDGRAYWSGFALRGALEWPLYYDLGELVNSSTAVVLARALGPGPTLEMGGDPYVPEDVQVIRSLRVGVLEVLAGELPEPQGELIVAGLAVPKGAPSSAPAVLFLRHLQDPRFRVPTVDPATLEDPVEREALATQQALWEEWTVDKYSLVNTQGVVAFDARDRAVMAARPDGGPLVELIEGRTFDELVRDIRRVADRPELAVYPGERVCCEPPPGASG